MKIINNSNIVEKVIYPDTLPRRNWWNNPQKEDGFRESKRKEEQNSQEKQTEVLLSVQANEKKPVKSSKSEEENITEQMMTNLENIKKLHDKEAILKAKQTTLGLLIKSARMLLTSRYTSNSWSRLVDALKLAVSVAGSKPPNMGSLDRAIGSMLIGLGGLEVIDANKEKDKGVREQLPIDENNSSAGGAGGADVTAVTAGEGGVAGVSGGD